MPAYYSATAASFLATPHESVLGTLISQAELAGFAQHQHTQTAAWRTSITIVSAALREIIAADPAASDWGVLFEFPIPRRSKRADVVILTGSRIFVLEFKVGQAHFDQSSQRQAIDYCLDLRDFHEPSRKRLLIPVVIATAATQSEQKDVQVRDFVAEPVLANTFDLPRILRSGSTSSIGERMPLAIDQWNEGNYRPTPTIIEAAQTLYAGHDVAEIAHSHAGASNLSTTRDAILGALHSAHSTNRKIICFVTGVPGSGKTLAGLNIAHNPNLKSAGDPLAVFLSGNGPLVRVLREALAIDYSQRSGATLAEARRKVATFIQNVHEFIAEYAEKQPGATPPDHVIIFDEAQRAWNAEQSKRKFDRDHSESALMLDIMARKPDWAVIVALVGAGQEINNGEAGLAEWGRALADRADTWSVSTSPHVIGSDDGLFRVPPSGLRIETNAALHLNVSLRSYRAQAVSDWVDAALAGRATDAASIAKRMSEFPIQVTRSLDHAKSWLRNHTRGTRRCGLVASSGARRLRAHGLDVTLDLDEPAWFLKPPDDVRSSYFLEVPATEFAVQGLELDWTGVCWGGDFTRDEHDWRILRFMGTRWQQDSRRTYVLNKYRVLMTRAREGMILWIPEGSDDDPTRPREPFDRTASYLHECGARDADD